MHSVPWYTQLGQLFAPARPDRLFVPYTRVREDCWQLVITRKFLRTIQAIEPKDQNMIRDVILPYLDRQIAAAEKKSE
jgi:hypothetical protein